MEEEPVGIYPLSASIDNFHDNDLTRRTQQTGTKVWQLSERAAAVLARAVDLELRNLLKMKSTIFIFTVCLLNSAAVLCQTDPLVEVSLGKIRGSFLSSSTGRRFQAFRGIPFAKSPTGQLRFEDPVAAEPWDGILDATREGPTCIQFDFVTRGVKGSEDCLMLNVYTHTLKPDGKARPVMVWIHGGGFFMGSGNGENDIFGPKHLMNNDIVLVTMNYRLGALGFYSTRTEKSPGNYGLLDQVQALKWVQDHILHFGGDPDSVTIFGESAGGASVHYHILSPLSKGLFRRAIFQSGTSLCPWARSEAVGKHSFYLAKKLGCLQKKSDAQLECVRSKKAEDLVLIPDQQFFPAMVFGPRVDIERTNPFLPADPTELLVKGQYNRVPVITGVTRNEGLAFIAASGLLSSKERLEQFESEWNNTRSLKYLLTIQDHPNAVEISRRAMEHYLKKGVPVADQMGDLEKMVSDLTFFKCVDDAVRFHTAHSETVYYYMYSHRGQHTLTDFYGKTDVDYGVCHADELLVMFSNDLLPPLTAADDIKMSKMLVDLWTSFASEGRPQSEEVIGWLPTRRDEPLYLNISVSPELVRQEMPFRHRLAFWNKIVSAQYSDEL